MRDAILKGEIFGAQGHLRPDLSFRGIPAIMHPMIIKIYILDYHPCPHRFSIKITQAKHFTKLN